MSASDPDPADPAGAQAIPVWTRDEAIRRLRLALQPMCGPDRSMCEVAASRGIFCRGFRRWHDSEFHRKWKGALGTSSHLTRAQMERLADIWQLSEQLRCGFAFACDASACCHGPCRGWDEFTNDALGRFCLDLLGARVVVSERLYDVEGCRPPTLVSMHHDLRPHFVETVIDTQSTELLYNPEVTP